MSRIASTSENATDGLEAASAALDHVAQLGNAETIASISVSSPVVSAASLARAFEGQLRFLWRDRGGALHASLGTLELVTGHGSQRFAIARDKTRDLYRRIAGTKRPLYGGFAFEPGSADSEAWAGFGDARFELPSVSYISDGKTAELRVNVKNPLSARARRDAMGELERHGLRIRRAALDPGPTRAVGLGMGPDHGREQYLELVRRARDEVRSGRFEKLVVARNREIALDEAPELAALLGRIDNAYRDCNVFCVKGDNGMLIAASPERLATVRGQHVETAALAGTVPLADAAVLHSDAKLQLEHRLTVNAIAAALRAAPGCDQVDVATVPRLYRLRKLVHLETPISARLDRGTHIFDVAAALHPTPAVAGIPTAEACDFLRNSETTPRGWYAGLVGWCNERGEGELAVALRAGLLSGETMHLYAGAGIVGDSVPETEWEETALKLSALGALLGGARR